MAPADELSCSACGWAGHRGKRPTLKGLTIHQNRCRDFQRETQELLLLHRAEKICKDEPHPRKRRRLKGDESHDVSSHGGDTTPLTLTLASGLNVEGELIEGDSNADAPGPCVDEAGAETNESTSKNEMPLLLACIPNNHNTEVHAEPQKHIGGRPRHYNDVVPDAHQPVVPSRVSRIKKGDAPASIDQIESPGQVPA